MAGPRNRTTPAPTQGASTRARGGGNPANTPAPTIQPTPEQTAAASEQMRANPGMSARWNSTTGAYEYVPIAGAPQNNPVTAQTMPGNNALGEDIARRQSVSTASRPAASTGQFDSGRQVITNDPAANLRAAAAANPGLGASQAGFIDPKALQGASSRFQVTSNPRPLDPRFNLDLTPTTTVVNPSKTEQGADQAKAALGPAPTIDMGLADRGRGEVDAALGLSRQAVDAALRPVDQTNLDAATADARRLLDQMLNGPNTAERIGSQTLRSQLALARSAAGGPGAVAGAFRNAQMAAPELQAQATEAGTRETLARQQAAGQITGQLQTTATNQQANDTARIGTAAQAASGFAAGALNSRGQDIEIAKSNQSAASNLLSDVSRLTGTQLELDQRNQELIGQMARDAAAMDFNWAQLDVQRQEAEFDRWVKTYGIDVAAAAQIKAAAKASDKSVWDYVIPMVGAAATIGGAIIAGPPGAAAGAAGGAALNAGVNG